MRVITGSARGLKIDSVDNEGVRPTLDRVKENIFNILCGSYIGGTVLDVFCGSGALGIEALSRGAARCVFVDSLKDSCNVTAKNLVKARLGAKADTVCADFDTYFKNTREKFDLILADPPYHMGLAEKTADAVRRCGCLAADGVLVLQVEAECDMCEAVGFETIKNKKYGKTRVLFLRCAEA